MEPLPAALCSRPRQPEAPVHRRTEALEQFNRDTPGFLVSDQAWWRAHPLGMLWPVADAAFVTSGGGGPPATARRSVVGILGD